MNTEKRKTEHLRVCMEEDVEFLKSNGFGEYRFVHNALPEINMDEIDISTTFLDRKFSAPLFIEAMTGGTKEAETINRNLAKAAQELGIGMGLGSQRAMIEKPGLTSTYDVKKTSPDVFLVGNIGASHIMELNAGKIREALEKINADALAIHINPAQEMCQEAGFLKWEGVLPAIGDMCSDMDIPVIVKEVGSGISAEVAVKLEKAGVDAIDVAGAGGTSWVKVDSIVGGKSLDNFFEWGIPTAESLEQCLCAVKIPVISSGGMRNGIEVAKSLSMGASLAGMALPLLGPAYKSAEEVRNKLDGVICELKAVMLLTGSSSIEELLGKAVRI